MSQVIISITLHGDVEGGVDDESGFYFELEKALGQVAQEFGLNAHIDDVHDNADGGLMQPDNFEKAWGVVKAGSCCDSPRLIERQDGSTRCRNCQQSKVSKEENLETKPPSYQGIGCAMCGEEAKMFIQCKLHPLMPYEWDDANFCSNCASEMMSMGGCSPCQNGEPPWSDD